MGEFKSLKLIFCKIRNQSELQGQGQVLEIIRDLYIINTQLKFEGKIPIIFQKLSHSQGITQSFF